MKGSNSRSCADSSMPMLFLQGTRDALADTGLLKLVLRDLKDLAMLHLAEGADHSFHVLKRSGRNDGDVLTEILDAFGNWIDKVVLR